MITQRTGQMLVQASPFNGVKLDLGFLILIAIPLVLVSGTWFPSKIKQIIFLAIYGLIAMAWLMLRSYFIQRHYRKKNDAIQK